MAKQETQAQTDVLEHDDQAQAPVGEGTSESAGESPGEAAPPKVFSRDQIRTAILDAKEESHLVACFGIEVEVRTPTLEDLLQYRDAADDDFAMARAIINNVFVPGTNEHVFDAADTEGLMKSKFTPDMRKLNKAVMHVLGGDEELIKAVDDDTKSN